MSIVEAVVTKGIKSALALALGAALVEFFQAVLAVRFSAWIIQHPQIETWITGLTIPLFILLGGYYLIKKPTSVDKPTTKSTTVKVGVVRQSFWTGALISGANMLAIPFWVFYATYLSGMEWIAIQNWMGIIAFSVGVTVGTFGVLFGYAYLGVWARTYAGWISHWASNLVGITFLILAASQVGNLIFQ